MVVGEGEKELKKEKRGVKGKGNGGGGVVKGLLSFALIPFRSFPLFFPRKNLMLMLLQNF